MSVMLAGKQSTGYTHQEPHSWGSGCGWSPPGARTGASIGARVTWPPWDGLCCQLHLQEGENFVHCSGVSSAHSWTHRCWSSTKRVILHSASKETSYDAGQAAHRRALPTAPKHRMCRASCGQEGTVPASHTPCAGPASCGWRGLPPASQNVQEAHKPPEKRKAGCVSGL